MSAVKPVKLSPELPGSIYTRGIRVIESPGSDAINYHAQMPRIRKVTGHLTKMNTFDKMINSSHTVHFKDGLSVTAMYRDGQMLALVNKTNPKRKSSPFVPGSLAMYKPYGGVIIRATRFELHVYEPEEASPEWKVITTADMIKDPPDEEQPIHRVFQLLHKYSPSRLSAAKFKKDRDAITATNVKIQEQITYLEGLPEPQKTPQVLQQIKDLKLEIRTNRAIQSLLHTDTDFVPKESLQLATFNLLGKGLPEHYNRYTNSVLPLMPRTVPDSEDYHLSRLFKATMFTGHMRQLIQYTMGLGMRRILPTVEKNGKPYIDYDYRTVKQAGTETWYAGTPSYQALFLDSYGLYKTSAGRVYVIRICPQGIFAMRLPVIRKTTDKLPEGMEWFPGIPLGIGFPRRYLTEAEQAVQPTPPKTPWQKALDKGWLFKIPCPAMDTFYEKMSPTYTECSWAFSYSGKKAVNVGWRYNEGEGFDYKIMEMWEVTFGGGDQGQNLEDYALLQNGKGFDTSIGTLTASMVLADSGPVASPGLEKLCANLKFPTLTMADWIDFGSIGVVSFDGSPQNMMVTPLEEPYKSTVGRFPDTDAMVHAFYDGEELQWLRAYHRLRPTPAAIDSFDTTMDSEYVATESPVHIRSLGAFTWGYTNVPAADEVNGFYSNKIDPRKPPEASEATLFSEGKMVQSTLWGGVPYTFPYPPLAFGWQDTLDPLGIENIPSSLGPGTNWVAPFQVFHVHVTGNETIGRRWSYGAAIPAEDREAMYILELEYGGSGAKYDSWYTTCCMAHVADVAPEWIPNLSNITNLSQVLSNFRNRPPGSESWTTYKFSEFIITEGSLGLTESKTWPRPEKYDQLEIKAYPTININSTNNDKVTPLPTIPTIHTIQSKVFPEYTKDMECEDATLWSMWMPQMKRQPTYSSATFMSTRSVIGEAADRQSKGVGGTGSYNGWNKTDISQADIANRFRPFTFIGETR